MMNRFFCDQRGTASIDAIVIFPVMAICLGSVYFFFSGYDAALQGATSARHEAWVASNAGCEGYESADLSDGSNPEGWFDALEEVPFIGNIVSNFFGEAIVVEKRSEFGVSSLVGGGTRTATYQYQIMCNLKHTSVGEVLSQAVCGTLADVGLDFC